MRKDETNIIVVKSKAFALRCIKLYRYLCDVKREFVLSKQLLRSATSIGANVREGLRGQSAADFGAKMNIALKEACESEYWIELLTDSDHLTAQEGESLMNDCKELNRILTSIVKTTFTKQQQLCIVNCAS